MRHAVINATTHIVENVILWDGIARWSPPAGMYVIESDRCDIGDTYDSTSKSFTKATNSQ